MKVSSAESLTVAVSFFMLGFFFFINPYRVEGAGLDAATIQCINCHEKGLNGEIVFHGKGSDHPIGLNYARLSTLNPSLVPVSKLNPALRLENGSIGCLTCHVAYNKKNHLLLAKQRARITNGIDPMLTLDNNKSGLCMACHRK